MKIGNINIKNGAALAPMAGVSDYSFRKLCSDFGAAFVVSEMISAKALTYGDKKTKKLLNIGKCSYPCAIQLFGCEAETMAKAAKIALESKPDFLDINMGCPAPKITSNNSGSALMKNPKLCADIIKAVVSVSNVPVTVKIRKGWDDSNINAVQIAKICEENGASAITIHGRTRAQMYRDKVDVDIIRNVKEAVKIPVIANGDICTAKDAANMLEKTNCDLVMVGRGAMGNPWIFSEISAFLNTDKILPPVGINERFNVMCKHIKSMCKEKGEHIGMMEARKHIAWYIKGFHGAAKFRKSAYELKTLKEFYRMLFDIQKQIGDIRI